jgi:hypothetical protein
VTALSLAAQAWPASNEAPRPVTQRGVGGDGRADIYARPVRDDSWCCHDESAPGDLKHRSTEARPAKACRAKQVPGGVGDQTTGGPAVQRKRNSGGMS